MKLIVGLGNPGKKYQKTRHNLGFMVLDQLAKKKNLNWEKDSRGKVIKSQAKINRKKVILAKPQTMMNVSGEAVAGLLNFYKLKVEDLWVIHDDLDLPLGKLKVQKNRGAAGHQGVASIIQKIKSKNFYRIRLGIGRPSGDLGSLEPEKYVLLPFKKKEIDRVEQMIKKALEALFSF